MMTHYIKLYTDFDLFVLISESAKVDHTLSRLKASFAHMTQICDDLMSSQKIRLCKFQCVYNCCFTARLYCNLVTAHRRFIERSSSRRRRRKEGEGTQCHLQFDAKVEVHCHDQ